MSLLNTKTGYTTPWHCSVAVMADGEWVSAPMGDFKKDPRFELVSENGRPSYFREIAYSVKVVTDDTAKQHSDPSLFTPAEKERHSPDKTQSSLIEGGKVGEPNLRVHVGMLMSRGYQRLRRNLGLVIVGTVFNSVTALIVSSIFYHIPDDTANQYGYGPGICFAVFLAASASVMEIGLIRSHD